MGSIPIAGLLQTPVHTQIKCRDSQIDVVFGILSVSWCWFCKLLSVSVFVWASQIDVAVSTLKIPVWCRSLGFTKDVLLSTLWLFLLLPCCLDAILFPRAHCWEV